MYCLTDIDTLPKHTNRVILTKTSITDKKAFQSNANRLLADRCMGYIANTFQQVHGGVGKSQSEQVWKCPGCKAGAGGCPQWTSLNMSRGKVGVMGFPSEQIWTCHGGWGFHVICDWPMTSQVAVAWGPPEQTDWQTQLKTLKVCSHLTSFIIKRAVKRSNIKRV